MLVMTTSCDQGVSVDLWCDACDASFTPPERVPPVVGPVWSAASDLGWFSPLAFSPLVSVERAGHYCPSCSEAYRAAEN